LRLRCGFADVVHIINAYYVRQVNGVNGRDTVSVWCVCVCVCAQRTGQSDQFKTFKAADFKFDMHVPRDSPDVTPKNFSKGGVARVKWPPIFRVLNANSSKMVKATDFKFDMHVSRDSSRRYALSRAPSSIIGDIASVILLVVMDVSTRGPSISMSVKLDAPC